jgi:hypothetical protein
MTVAFTHYAKVRNKYCYAYYGLVPEYVTQLRMLRPLLSRQFPDLTVFISCLDDFMYLMGDEENTITFTEMKENKARFAHIHEIGTSINPPHAIWQVIKDTVPDIKLDIQLREQHARRCFVCPDGALPTKSYQQVERLKAYAAGRGFTVKVVGSEVHPGHCQVDFRPVGAEKLALLEKTDWVIGVENEFLFEAIRRGIKTTLVPTGIGTELYKKLCPSGEILQL